MQFNCIQSFFGVLVEEAFREGDREGLRGCRERDVSEKGLYCLTRPIGLNCPNLPKTSLKTKN